MTRNHDYSIASIDNETLEASKGNANAFLEAATTEIDGAINSITNSLATAIYGTGSGSLGRIANSSFATVSLQLSDLESVVAFEVGMILVASATDGTGTVRAGQLSIVAVNRDSGVITVDQNISAGIAAIAQNDYLFVKGDYGQKIKGLRAWLPDTAPTSTPFFSVDRTSDATRLAGIRVDGTNMPIEEALIKAANRVAREGGKPDHVFVSFNKFNDLVNSLGAKVQYVQEQVKAGQGYVGFQTIQIHGPRGVIKVVPDRSCPSDRAFMLQMDVWKLYSLGKCPRILEADGLKMLRDATSDAMTVRVGYYAQLGCRGPGFNANIAL